MAVGGEPLRVDRFVVKKWPPILAAKIIQSG